MQFYLIKYIGDIDRPRYDVMKEVRRLHGQRENVCDSLQFHILMRFHIMQNH